MLSTTFKRIPLHGCLALMPVLASAQIGPMLTTEPMRSVRRLGDGELSCAQIHAETQALEKTGQIHRAEAAQAQQAMTDTQNEMMKLASEGRGGVGSAIGGSLLGLIPGGSQVQGYAMQAAAEARRAGMQDSTNKMMQAQTRLVNAEQALEHVQARSEHLVDLFLKKGCKLSEVKAATDAAQ
ncbi:hypothetical protein [uncultured Hydrogenophaga sp.]|uniref:hypothetical protein n=1 Tax=uncultured Hydrogenophaga sp. TaxID=199683 RepID=UPI002585AF71|nr:hypothetical protein [uncultured Hydrogenophaga sp.]